MKNILLLAITLFIALQNIAQNNASVTALIAKAKKQATKENKKILLRFTASWCGWCHRMDAAMKDNKTKNLFNKSFVILPITVLENNDKKSLETPGGDSLLIAQGGGNSGIPYWLVLNNDGTLLANSKNKTADKPLTADGNNVGCPAQPEEIAYFLRVLAATTTLSKKELKIIEIRFKKIITEK